jgi:hypothetical protein
MASFGAVTKGWAVYIILNQYSTDEEGEIFITPDMMSENEIDGNVRYLVSEIEKAGNQAKRKLAKANEKIKKTDCSRENDSSYS